jgi:hypothetical protein
MRRGLVSLACALGLCSLLASAAFAQFPTGPTRDASELAGAIVGDPSSLSSASFVAIPPGGAPAWRGVGWGPQGPPLDGQTLGAISTGDARHRSQPGAAGKSCFPSGAVCTWNVFSTDNGGAQTRGGAYDVTILRLELDVPQGANCLGFAVNYLSEDFAYGAGNDDVRPFLDGFVAELDGTTPWSLDGASTAAPDNFAVFDFGNGLVLNPLSADPDPSIYAGWGNPAGNASALDSNYAGGTGWLHVLKEVSPGAHALELSIFDRADPPFTSTALIDDVSLVRRLPGRCPTGGGWGIPDLHAPAVSLTAPADGASTGQGTVTMGGTAGVAPGDESTLGVRVYSGGQAAGSPLLELAAAAGAGTWQATVEPPLPPGTYTAEASQRDGDGNEGLSAAHTFTVLAPAASPPAGTGGAPPAGEGSTGPAGPPAVTCRVARLKGKTLKAARASLTRANCRLGKVTRRRARGRPGRVIGQKPKAGSTRPQGTRVTVVLSKRRR